MIAASRTENAERVLCEALEAYRGRIVLACSFGGPSGMVLVDLVMKLERSVPVFYLDTGLLFAETYALIERVRERYGIDPVAVVPELDVAAQAKRYGEALWARDPDACCDIRKVEPQRAFLSQYDAWITGVRREQSTTRYDIPFVEPDGRGLAKIAPLADWSERDVWSYIAAHDVPYNPLNDRGYPSLGCTHCTRAVAPGEDSRAGRWPGFAKTECGIHVTELRDGARAPEMVRAVDGLAADDRGENLVPVVPNREIGALAGQQRAAIAVDAEQTRGC